MELNGYIKFLIFVVAILVIYYLLKFVRRIKVYNKIKKKCKKENLEFKCIPSFISYIFGQRRKIDFLINNDTAIKVIVIGRKKCRLHLSDNNAYLFFSKRNMYVVGRVGLKRRLDPANTSTSTFRIKNALSALKNSTLNQKTVIIYPTPKEISTILKNGVDLIAPGEMTETNYRVESLKTFIGK